MAKESSAPKKFNRLVKPYKRKVSGKTIYVEGYRQSYVAPRGPVKKVKPDRLTTKSQTMWLMDKQGHFIGRANYNGDTTAYGVYMYGLDRTTNIRDALHFKRIFGRTSPGKVRRVRRR